MPADRPPLYRPFQARCEAAGLDLVQPFGVATFHRGAPARERLAAFGRENALGLVVGNTRRLWDVFRDALRSDARLLAQADPLDAYVTAAITRAATELAPRALVSFAHVLEPAPIPIQRIAEAAGLAQLSPSHLSVHSIYGPWIALRAVVVVDVDFEEAEPAAGGANRLCDGCARPCMPAFEAALRGATASGAPLGAAIRDDFRPWVRVREVCPAGRAHRYDEGQIEYHYARRRARLVD
jgi:methylmalonic aciduria homocystinuria type C protein